MADEADVRYVLRADSSRLQADLNEAENTIRRSAQRTEQSADRIGESAERAFGQTAESAQDCGKELGNLGDNMDDVGNKSEKTADKAENKLGKALGTVGKTAAAASAAVGAAAAAVGTAAVKSADSLDKAVNRVISATGASEDAAEQYADVIKGVYGDNFGESFDDIAVSISKITQNLGELDNVTLQNVTERAYTLQDVFDMGVDESSRAAKAMADNFGVSAEKAYDYIAKGAQDGLDYSGELLDSISEYSVQFAKLGFSADDMFNIFAQGAENGAWNLDKVGDAIKEFSIRAIDGSDTTKAGFQAIGYDAEDMAKKFAEGGDVARDAFKTVVTALAEMEDPISRDAAGVNLFGTMWEDLGVEAVAALGNISDSAYDCAGAMDGIMAVNYGSLSDALGGLQRQVELLIQPLGDSLIPIVSEVIDELSGMADEVIPELLAAIQPVIENLTPLIEPLLRLVSSVLPQLIELVTPLIEMISELIQTVLPPLTNFLESELIPVVMNIVSWVSDKIFPIVTKIIERVLPPLLDILESLLPLIELVLNLLDPILGLVMGLIDPIADILELIAPILTLVADLISKGLKPLQEKLDKLAPFLEEVLGRALKIVAELIEDTLLPAFDGLLKFLSGDFMGGIESWGNGFENTVRNVFSHIDEIFGTHLAEWYDEFNAFWMDMGSKLYEMTHGDEIELQTLNAKYSSMQSDLYAAVKSAIYSGKSVDEAVSEAKRTVIDTDEKAYLYSKMAESWNLEGVALDYYNGKDIPEPSVKNNGLAGSSWYAEYYKNGDNLPSGQPAAVNKADSSAPGTTEYSYTPYTPAAAKTKSTSKTGSGGSSSGKGNFISITSYVPTMWDNDQTAALKSLIGKEVLGKTTTAHQINELTGAISTSAQSTSASNETTLADVVNAITKLQRRVDNLSTAIGDTTIELKARDLTIGKACVRDCNDMAKQSGKSPFNF